MLKEDFIKKVSKIDKTFEDEFKAKYNSPELIWRYLKKNGVFSNSCTCTPKETTEEISEWW